MILPTGSQLLLLSVSQPLATLLIVTLSCQAKGLNAHAEFLNNYKDIMSSPSKRLPNQKFGKSSVQEAIKGASAQIELQEKDAEST